MCFCCVVARCAELRQIAADCGKLPRNGTGAIFNNLFKFPQFVFVVFSKLQKIENKMLKIAPAPFRGSLAQFSAIPRHARKRKNTKFSAFFVSAHVLASLKMII